ncbi:MAG: aminoglycoside phosphotransferase family protein [Bacillota bacterium]|nr:aminoglycoside phosphotransferase family protein [Bacillota bacterium]
MKTDISQWEVLSRRPGSSNYISPDRKWMVKTIISSHDNDLEVMQSEQRLSDAVYAMGIPTPKNDGIIELEGNEFGIVYEFIEGKESLSRAISKDKSRMVECMKKFDELGKSIHFTECDTEKFESFESRIRDRITRVEVLTEDEKKKILDFVDSVPKATTCIHGDFHPGNFITSPAGDFVIDLGNFTYGNQLYDWGHWWFMSHVLPEETQEAVFHTDRESMIEYWNLSLEYAFGAKTDEERKEKENEIRPYAMLTPILYFEEKPVERGLVEILMKLTGLA